MSLRSNALITSDGFFVPIEKLADYPFSTLMKKVIKKGITEKI
jgi:hypothetical protein